MLLFTQFDQDTFIVNKSGVNIGAYTKCSDGQHYLMLSDEDMTYISLSFNELVNHIIDSPLLIRGVK